MNNDISNFTDPKLGKPIEPKSDIPATMPMVIVESPFAGAGNISVDFAGHPDVPIIFGQAKINGRVFEAEGTTTESAEKAVKREIAIHYARAAMNDSFMRGEAPYASHLLYTQEGILDDDIPEERERGIEAGLLWGEKASKTVVYIDLGISDGMAKGIRRAKEAGRPIEQRSIKGWK